MRDQDTETMDGPDAVRLYEMDADWSHGFDQFICGRCGEAASFPKAKMKVLLDTEGRFVAMKAPKGRDLHLRNNGNMEYATFWCSHCTRRANKNDDN